MERRPGSLESEVADAHGEAPVVASPVSAEEARKALGTWVALYEAREKAFRPALEAALPGKDAWAMDGFLTFLEGVARYVEARVLMAPREESFALLDGEPTFARFATTRGKSPTQLPGLGKMGPKYFYALGMYLSFALDRADPDWKAKVFETDRLLLGHVERVVRGGR